RFALRNHSDLVSLLPQTLRGLHGDAAAGDGRNFSLCGVLYDPGGRPGYDVAHARCPQDIRRGNLSHLWAERENGTRTVRGRARCAVLAFQLIFVACNGSRNHAEPFVPYWHSDTGGFAVGPAS